MRNYEAVVIMDPDLASEASKSLVTQVQDWVSKNGGRVDGLQEWGKKKLAYKIKKKHEGIYVLFNFQIDTKHAKKLEQNLRLNDQVLRYLLINKDER